MNRYKRILPAFLAICLMSSSLASPALASTRKAKTTTSKRKTELFKLDAKAFNTTKSKTGNYWNVSPETFMKSFESVFDGAVKISDNKKANKNVFSYTSDAVTLSLYATSDSFSKSKLTKVTIEIKETTKEDNFKTYGILLGGVVTIFSQYNNEEAAKIIQKLQITNADNDFKPVSYTYKTAKYNMQYAEKKVTLSITPVVK